MNLEAPEPMQAKAGNVTVLITNGANTHSPAKWAEYLTNQLLDLDDKLSGERLNQAIVLRGRIQKLLTDECDRVASRAKWMKISRHDAAAVEYQVQKLAQDTNWALSFQLPETRLRMRMAIDTVMNSILRDELSRWTE